jgi:hypothetical protein
MLSLESDESKRAGYPEISGTLILSTCKSSSLPQLPPPFASIVSMADLNCWRSTALSIAMTRLTAGGPTSKASMDFSGFKVPGDSDANGRDARRARDYLSGR